MFENKKTHNGIHYSRYIASWKKMGGKIYRGGLFEQWLKKEGLTEEEISDILLLAENGKLELEYSARMFMRENKEKADKEKKMANVGGIYEECKGRHMDHIEMLYDKYAVKYGT